MIKQCISIFITLPSCCDPLLVTVRFDTFLTASTSTVTYQLGLMSSCIFHQTTCTNKKLIHFLYGGPPRPRVIKVSTNCFHSDLFSMRWQNAIISQLCFERLSIYGYPRINLLICTYPDAQTTDTASVSFDDSTTTPIIHWG